MILDTDTKEATPGGGAVRRAITLTGLLAVTACLLWFGLGMNRGVLLSNDVKAVMTPWAPFYPEKSLSGAVVTDPVFQFVPWLELARREIAAGRLPLWNPHQDGGVPLLGNCISALGSPLVWPVLALGVAPGWNLSLLLRLLVALATAYAWLREEGRSGWAAAIGACGFALSGPFVAWLEHPQTAAVAGVPLLFLLSRRAAREGGGRAVAGLALATCFVLAGGHPETQLLAALLVAAMLIVDRPRPAGFARCAGGALLGAGLAAPLLFPFLEYFRLSAARSGIDREPHTLPLRDLLRFLVPRLSESNPTEAAATVSVTMLLLAAIGLVQTRKDRRSIFWGAVALAIALVVYENPLSRLLASRTPIYWTRALLFLPLALVFLGSAGLDAVRERIARKGRSSEANWVSALASAVILAELLAAAQGVHSVTSVHDFRPSTPLLSRLAADPEPFRILPLETLLLPNSATDYGLDDVRGYDALSPLGWRQRRAAMGQFFGRHTDVIRPEGVASGGHALDFWNVKYLLVPPDLPLSSTRFAVEKRLDLEEVYAGPDGRIWRNRRSMPRARLTVPGSVQISDRVPCQWIFDLDASAPGALVVANPFFPGWTARIDGTPVLLAASPGDPVVLAVSAGRHRVELSYRPASWSLGLLVSGVSMAAVIVAAVRWRQTPRRRRIGKR